MAHNGGESLALYNKNKYLDSHNRIENLAQPHHPTFY